jgi:hypothetical protein
MMLIGAIFLKCGLAPFVKIGTYKMNEPKYQIGDRIPNSELVVRGIAPQKDGNYVYFVQIVESDNTFVGTEKDIVDVLNSFRKSLNRLKSIAGNSDRNI